MSSLARAYDRLGDGLAYHQQRIDSSLEMRRHEVALTIHHDAMTKVQESRKILAREVGTAILLGPTLQRVPTGMNRDSQVPLTE